MQLIFQNRKTNIHEWLEKECKKYGRHEVLILYQAVDSLERVLLERGEIKLKEVKK